VRKDIPHAERTYLAGPTPSRESESTRRTLGRSEEKLVCGSGSGSRINCAMGPDISSCAHAESTGNHAAASELTWCRG
jgi:hypothetical protein